MEWTGRGSWRGANGPLVRIGSRRHGKFVRPGETLKIGRHSSNDLIVGDKSVSRFHALVSWAARATRPTVHDLGSHNGLVVGGYRLSEAELSDGASIVVGNVTLPVTLTGVPSAIFSHEGRGHGVLPGRVEIETLLAGLEREACSGTLQLSWERASATLTFLRGRILSAHSGALSGRGALDRVLSASGASYTFGPRYAVGHSVLNVWPSMYLRERPRLRA